VLPVLPRGDSAASELAGYTTDDRVMRSRGRSFPGQATILDDPVQVELKVGVTAFAQLVAVVGIGWIEAVVALPAVCHAVLVLVGRRCAVAQQGESADVLL